MRWGWGLIIYFSMIKKLQQFFSKKSRDGSQEEIIQLLREMNSNINKLASCVTKMGHDYGRSKPSIRTGHWNDNGDC